jgi:hypothetical protein
MEEVPRERLEAHVEELRALVDKLTGQQKQQEDAALGAILAAVREHTPNVDPESDWGRRMNLLGFTLAQRLGVHSTIEEFTAQARLG